MTAIIHLKSGESATVESFSAVKIFKAEGHNHAGEPCIPAEEVKNYDFIWCTQCNFVGEKKIISVRAADILYLETIID